MKLTQFPYKTIFIFHNVESSLLYGKAKVSAYLLKTNLLSTYLSLNLTPTIFSAVDDLDF